MLRCVTHVVTDTELLGYLQEVCLGGDSISLDHGDEDGNIPQRAALPPRYTHPQGVCDTLKGDMVSETGNDIMIRTLRVILRFKYQCD